MLIKRFNWPLTLSQTSPGFYVSTVRVYLKTLWEKKKLLVTSNFSFSHSVFYRFGKLSGIFMKLSSAKSSNLEEFNPFPNKPWFLRVCSISLLKTLREKEKLLVTSNFPFSHSVFYLFKKLSAIFIKFEIVVRKLFQFGRV